MQKKMFQKVLSICLALSVLIGLMPQSSVFAAGDTLKICVISDAHYYPLTYVSDCEDYQTYVNGDPKMLAESGSILDAAVEMIEKDQPDIVLVSGDLTKDGEKKGHQEFAAEMQQIEDHTDAEVFVINGNHDIYNYQDACTFENGKKENTELLPLPNSKKSMPISAITGSSTPITTHPLRESRPAAFLTPLIWGIM